MKLLPPSSIHLLSSGQVVTSVVSVVKELVENAVDGAATKIEVKLDKFGFDKIEVQDNGISIPICEAKFMALPHYTSKIMSFTDVEALTTYGFRGEALSCIAAVADLSIVTKTADESIAVVHKFDHKGNVESSKPVAACTGTAVIVTNLFKNIPVRRQICRNERVQKRELKQIEELLMHFAVAWPQTRISLYHNRCLIWGKTSVPDIDGALSQVCGRSWTSCVQKVEIQDCARQISLEAFLPKATQLEPSTEGERSRTFILINNRPVIMKELDKIVRKAFVQVPTLKEKSSVLGYCIYLTVPPSTLDVNLEPNKTKVMLQDKETIVSLLSEVLDKLYNSSNPPVSLDHRSTMKADCSSSESRLEAQPCVPPPMETEKCPIPLVLNALPQNKSKQNPSLSDLFVITEDQYCDVNKSNCADLSTTASNPVSHILPCDVETSVDKTVLEDRTKSIQSTDYFRTEVPGKQHSNSEEQHSETNDNCLGTSTCHNLNSQQKPQVNNKDASNRNLVRQGTNSDAEIEMEIEIENELANEKRNRFNAAWSKGTLKDTAECVLQPVQLMNPLPKRPLSLRRDVSGGKNNNFSPETNPKKKKCTNNSNGQTTLYSITPNRPAKHQLSAYTLFARDIRLEVMNQNPSSDFSGISKIIYDKWQSLSEEEREVFELKASTTKGRQTSLKQKLVKDQMKPTAAESKPTKPPLNHASKNLVAVRVVKVEFELKKLQARIARPKIGPSKLGIYPKEYQFIGQLVKGCWVCCHDNELGLYNHLRARETQLFFNMMANHRIPTKVLDSPLVLNESLVGGSQYWKTLITLSSSPGVPPCYQYLDDSRLLSNGIKIKKWLDEATDAHHAEIVGLADCMAFYGVGDLKDILKKLSTNQFLTVEESRPLKVINYFKEEAVRMVRQLPLKVSKDAVVELNHKLMKVPLPSRATCIHGRFICEPVFKIHPDNSL